MKVTKEDGDYTVLLSEADIKKATTKVRVSWSVFPQLPTLSAEVESESDPEELTLAFTSDYDVVHHPRTYDGINFYRHETGPVVQFCMPTIGRTFIERGFVVTRYDGHSDKLWIRKDESLENPEAE